MDALRWTTTAPTEPGWYWEYNEGYARVMQVYVWHGRRIGDSGSLWIDWPFLGRISISKAPSTKWAGPIPAPEGP